VRTVLADLEREGVPAESLARVHAPVGLDLGGQSPAEIALSILAQIIAERNGRVGATPLSALDAGAGREDADV
jgi:xanthine dehydrogenase accessory factor